MIEEFAEGGFIPSPGLVPIELEPGERIIDRDGYTIAVVGCTWPAGHHSPSCDWREHVRTARPRE